MQEYIDLYSPSHNNSVRIVLATILLGGMGILLGWLVPTSGGALTLLFAVGLGVMGAILLWPALPVTLLYPLAWPAWSFAFPLIGRPERAIGILAIVGLGIAALRFRSRLASFPPLVTGGMFLLLISTLGSAISHPESSRTPEYMISLFLRLAFFYLVVFHLQTRQQLRRSLVVFIASGMFAALLIFYLSIKLGPGFTRAISTENLYDLALGPFWTTFALNANFDTAPALLLWCLYPLTRTRSQKWLVVGVVVFLLGMAFAAQYRRELVLSIPLTLLWFVLDQHSGLRRPTLKLLAAIGIAFLVIFLPTQVFQDRLQFETQYIESGDEARIVSLRAGLIAFPASPLVGFGLGAYDQTVAPIIGTSRFGFGYEYHPYNTFIWLAVESGLFAVAGMVFILLGVYRKARQALPSSTGVENWVLRAAPALMIQSLIWLSFGNAFDVSIIWYLMGIILAAAWIGDEHGSDERAGVSAV